MIEDIKGITTPRDSYKGGAGEVTSDHLSYDSAYRDFDYHLQRIPKILPIDVIERDTYRFVENHPFRYPHPYGPPNDIPDTLLFPMFYTGIMLHDKPHGMGILELKDVPREDPSSG